MERVLITGSTGFIGKALLNKLGGGKYEIHTLERYVTGRYSLDQSGDVVRHNANLTDYSSIKNIVKDVKPDYVIHLASISAVSFSYDRYIEVSDVNYIGTLNLAEACYREAPNLKQFLFAGTSEEYGMLLKDNKSKLKEDMIQLPNSPYAVAKVAAEYYLKYMHIAYNFPCTILRPFNTYGRTDNPHFFIERTITQMLTKNRIYLGDPKAVRDWVYVDDHANGYVKAIGNEKAIGQVINLCTGVGYSTKQVAELIAELTKFDGEIVWNSTPRRPLDAQYLIGDNTKAHKLLNWEPKYDLKAGLKLTIAYWRNAIKNKHSSN